jgi:hypothetical protein
MTRTLPKLLITVMVLACVAGESRALGADQKLFLKDGTYQLVSSYEMHGDRVRYYSVERSDWEEIPSALVDFEATKQAQEQEKVIQKKRLDEGREIEAERFDKPVETGFEVAPGVHLPQEEGVYAYDGTRVIRLIRSSTELVTDRKRAALAIALPGPLTKNRSIVELAGARAAVRLQQAEPTFYAQFSDDLGARLGLISVKAVKESRLVERVDPGRAGAGKPSQLRVAVPLEYRKLATGLYRLTPLHPLDPGEYALGELTQLGPNLALWDFGLFETPSKPSEQRPTARRDSDPN